MAEVPIEVRLAEGAESGLANIVQQFLEQSLEEVVTLRNVCFQLRMRRMP